MSVAHTAVRSLLGLLLAWSVAHADPVPTFTGDRLFVVRSWENVAQTLITAFDVDHHGLPARAETHVLLVASRGNTSSQQPALATGGEWLFVPFNEDRSIGVFSVSPSGQLEQAPGSPFGVEERPTRLAAHPHAPYLYASAFTRLFAFEVGPDGSLTEIQRIPSFVRDVAIEPGGGYLYFAVIGGEGEGVRGFEILPTGMLLELAASPFRFPGGQNRPFEVEISTDFSRLYAVDLDTGLAAYEVRPGGVLAGITQVGAGRLARPLELTPDDRFAYVGRPLTDLVHGFDLVGDLLIEVPGSPFRAPESVTQIVAAPARPLLYHVARTPGTVQTHAIAADGSLSLVDEIEIGTGFRPNGAVYLGARQPPIAVDVKPGNDDNQIDVGSDATISVAVLGSGDLDVTELDWTSLRFGPDSAPPIDDAPRLEDVNRDARPDLVVRFRSSDTGVRCEMRSAWLVGTTLDGSEVGGADRVKPTPCG